MNPEEFDTSLTDLETRVDRLRALYENWFRGYEKTEPAVARRDVERRVYALRKELPRNTALRFRYHQLFQRFTTLANYWQRTARQIEEGTHRLQLQRMRRRRPSEPAPATLPPGEARTSDAPPSNAYALDLDESLDVQKLLDEAEFDHIATALEGARPVASQAPAPSPAAPSMRAVGRFARPSLSADAPNRSSLSLDLGQGAPSGAQRPPHASIEGRAPGTGTMSMAPAVSGRPPPATPAGAPQTGSVPMPPPPSPQRSPSPSPQAAPARSAAVSPRPSMPASPPGRAAPPAASSAAAQPAISEQHMRRIYDEYAAARRKNNEGEVRFETLQGSIQKMLPELHKKHQGKQIDFEVVVKDGRVGLKPRAT